MRNVLIAALFLAVLSVMATAAYAVPGGSDVDLMSIGSRTK